VCYMEDVLCVTWRTCCVLHGGRAVCYMEDMLSVLVWRTCCVLHGGRALRVSMEDMLCVTWRTCCVLLVSISLNKRLSLFEHSSVKDGAHFA